MWRFIILFSFLFPCGQPQTSRKLIIEFVNNTLREINEQYKTTDPIRQQVMITPAFEIGFVLRNMEECYRRMVDIYNSCITTDLYNWGAKPSDHIQFLKHIEIMFWVVDHLANMLHEVEKKYKVKMAGMFEKQREWTTPKPRTSKHTRFVEQAVPKMTTPTKRPRQSWWPLDYGWPMDYKW